jgi:hypothetical protein
MLVRSRTPDSRALGWIATATALHAIALASLLVVPVRRARDAPVSAVAPPIEIAITIDGEPSAARSPLDPAPTVAAESGRPSAPSAGIAARRSATSGLSSGEPVGAASTGEGPPAEPSGAPTAGAGVGVVPIPLSSAQLGLAGIGAQNPFLPRAEEKVPTTGPDHPAARALRGTGLAHDREIGLGPEGPVVRALEEATPASIAPLRGRALFVVRSGGDGVVSGIELVDFEGGSGWLDAGKIALANLRGKKLVVPRGANGLSMQIEVRSEMKLPNGQNAQVGVQRGDFKMPELTVPDPSNVGVQPRRVVHSRVVSTELL